MWGGVLCQDLYLSLSNPSKNGGIRGGSIPFKLGTKCLKVEGSKTC